jgi:choice-of-anchor A domain-containing protein
MLRIHRLAAASLITLACVQAHAVVADLGEASLFSVVTFGNFTGISGDTGSLLAAGGDVSLTNWNVNAYGTPGYAGQSLIVGGNFVGTSGQVNGIGGIGVMGTSTIGGTSTTSSFNTGTVTFGASPLNFTVLKTQLDNTSASVASAAATGTVQNVSGVGGAPGTTQLIGTNSDVEVFAIDGSQLSANDYLKSTDVKAGATVILNVSGTSVSMSSFGFDLAGGAKDINLLFNFYQATSLSFANLALEGSVLAPHAAVTGASGHIGGTFVAQSFTSAPYVDSTGAVALGNFEFHDMDFTPTSISSAVPEPSEWALMLAGGVCVLLVAQRRRGVRRPAPASARRA